MVNACNELATHLRDNIDGLVDNFFAQYGFIPETTDIVETVKSRTAFLLQEWAK